MRVLSLKKLGCATFNQVDNESMTETIDKETLDKLRCKLGAGVVIWYGEWVHKGNWHNAFDLLLIRFMDPNHSLVISYPAKSRCIVEIDGKCIFSGTPYQAHQLADSRRKARPVALPKHYVEALRNRAPLKVMYTNPDTGRRNLFYFENIVPMRAVA